MKGILDPEMAPAANPPGELKRVLCGGGACEQRSFQVRPALGGFGVDFAKDFAKDFDEGLNI